MATYTYDALYIDGSWTEATSGATRDVINPHSEEARPCRKSKS